MDRDNDARFKVSKFFTHRLRTVQPLNYTEQLSHLVIPGNDCPALSQLIDSFENSFKKWYRLFFESRDLEAIDHQQVLEATEEYVALLLLMKDSSSLESDVGASPNPPSQSSLEPSFSSPSEADVPKADVPKADVPNASSLQKSLWFSWRNIAGPAVQTVLPDVSFELCSVLFNQAIWLLGYSAHLLSSSAKDEERRLKLAYDCLLKASGYLAMLPSLVSHFSEAPLDFSSKFLLALEEQALAQAQEITIERAIAKGNSPGLISKLCHDTYERYMKAFGEISQLPSEGSRLHRFSTFLEEHEVQFMAMSFQYQAFKLQSEDQQYGNAIASLKQAVALAKSKSSLSELQRHLELDLEKAVRENDFVAQEKVPEDAVPLESPKSLVKPTVYKFPPAAHVDSSLLEKLDPSRRMESCPSVPSTKEAESSKQENEQGKCMLL